MKEGRQDKIVTNHKEDSNARKQTDAVDRAKIRDTLATFINPVDTSSHPSRLVNITTGLLAPSNVNVDSSVTGNTRWHLDMLQIRPVYVICGYFTLSS